MKYRDALRALTEVTESQWGMVTSTQARARGISHMNLTRLAEAGDLVRLAHGVYRDAGSPSEEHEGLRAAWLAIEPGRLAYERLSDRPNSAVVSGESACALHGIGSFRAMRSEFTTPTRKQTQRSDLRYRTRNLPSADVAVRGGLPVTTRERTIADLVEDRQDFSTIASALRDAAMQSALDNDRLAELLSPLAARNGHRAGDGMALLDDLMREAEIDLDSLAAQAVAIPEFGSRVAAAYLPEMMAERMAPMVAALESLTKQMRTASPSSTHESYTAALEQISKQIAATMPDLSQFQKAVGTDILTATVLPPRQLQALKEATQRMSKQVTRDLTPIHKMMSQLSPILAQAKALELDTPAEVNSPERNGEDQ